MFRSNSEKVGDFWAVMEFGAMCRRLAVRAELLPAAFGLEGDIGGEEGEKIVGGLV